MQDYLDSTSGLESPKSYFYWAMLTTIAAVAGKKLWINRGNQYNLYPNIYTFILSKHSGLGKNAPISIAKKLTNEMGKIRLIDGQNSIQGVLKELSQVRTVGNGNIIRDAEGFLISGEFASFMLQDGIGFSLTTLTDLYDTHAYIDTGFKKRLATQDELELKKPCLTALFASNETHFFETVPKHAINGGFIARVFCIYEEKRNTLNSLTGRKVTNPKPVDYLKILGHLSDISKLSGELIVEPKALDLYDEWYYSFYGDESEEDDTGVRSRLKDQVWKAAMLISLTNSQEKIIFEADIKEAIEKTLETYTSSKRLLLGGSGDSKNIKAMTMRTTIACMLSCPPNFECDRKLILKKGAGVFGVYDLDETIEHLLQAGMLKQRKSGQSTYYQLTEVVIRKHLEMEKGKSKEAIN